MRKFFKVNDGEWVDRDLVIGITIYYDPECRMFIVRYQFSVPVFDIASEENGYFIERSIDTRDEAEAKVARFLAGDPE